MIIIIIYFLVSVISYLVYAFLSKDKMTYEKFISNEIQSSLVMCCIFWPIILIGIIVYGFIELNSIILKKIIFNQK